MLLSHRIEYYCSPLMASVRMGGRTRFWDTRDDRREPLSVTKQGKSRTHNPVEVADLDLDLTQLLKVAPVYDFWWINSWASTSCRSGLTRL